MISTALTTDGSSIRLALDELIAIKWAYWKKVYWHNRNVSERRKYAIDELRMCEKLTIEWNDERWMSEYSWMIWSCHSQLNTMAFDRRTTSTKTEQQYALTSMYNKYHSLLTQCQSQFVRNHPIRLRILRDYTILCNQCGRVLDDATMNDLERMFNELCNIGQDTLTDEQYDLSSYWRQSMNTNYAELRAKRYIF